jgi:protein-disulfide isomerase
MRRLVGTVTLLAALALAGTGATAQPADDLPRLRRDVDRLKEEQAKIRSELQAIREMLQGRGGAAPGDQPKDLVLALGDDPVKGDRKARLVLVDFSDYQ